MILKGRVWRFGDEVNTDTIIPSAYTQLSPAEYKTHIMELVRPGFYGLLKEGDFIFAGKGFGIGSSRGQAVVALKEAGIRAIVAHSFARIFYRSGINEGLPLIECPEAYEKTVEGDWAAIDIAAGIIRNEKTSAEFHFYPFPDFVKRILEAGGGAAYYRNQHQS